MYDNRGTGVGTQATVVGLVPDDVASAVLGVVNAAPGASPLEVVLEPARDPMRTG